MNLIKQIELAQMNVILLNSVLRKRNLDNESIDDIIMVIYRLGSFIDTCENEIKLNKKEDL